MSKTNIFNRDCGGKCSHASMNVSITQKTGNGIVVALVGQPNTGKSSVFNALTGLRQHVGNWPGKTVECKTGRLERAGRAYTFVDLPGCYGLTANSTEEQIARDYAVSEDPDIIVAVVNAAALERTLYLVAELSMLDTPLVIALNMTDVAGTEGIQVDADKLSHTMGIPVVPMVASRNLGIAKLLTALDGITSNMVQQRNEPNLPKVVEEVTTWLGDDVPKGYPTHWVSSKLLEADNAISDTIKSRVGTTRWKQLDHLLGKHPGAFAQIVEERRAWIEAVCEDAVIIQATSKRSPTDTWDRAFLHPIWGAAIAVSIFPAALYISLNIGLIPAIKLYKVYFGIRTSVMNSLPGALGSLLSNGIMLPITWIVAMSLILFIIFIVLAFFEDIGFLARITYLSDPLMRRLGLDAKSVIPIFFGFICNACSVLGTRVIETHHRRLQTIAMAPFIPCSAQIMVAGFMAFLFFPYRTAMAIVLGIIAANLFFAGLAGKWAQRRYPSPVSDGLIMELPLFHRPNLRTIFISAWSRVRPFITRGATLMLPIMILFWAVSYFPHGEINTSFMARAGRYIEPITGLMGMNWRFTSALIFSFIARENTLTALSIFLLTGTQEQFYFTVHGPEKEAVLEVVRQSIAPAGALAFIVASNFFIPCVGTIGAINAETKSLKWTLGIVIALFVIAFVLAVLTYQIAQYII